MAGFQALRVAADGAACDRSSVAASERCLPVARACGMGTTSSTVFNPPRVPGISASLIQPRATQGDFCSGFDASGHYLRNHTADGRISCRHTRMSSRKATCSRKGKVGVRALHGETEEYAHPRRSTPAWSTASSGYAASITQQPEAWVSCQTGECSIARAFSSMVTMLKALQSYALQMMYDDFQSITTLVHKEMQASFLWLFQQVFSCTPVLMVAVMLLFSDFTFFSTSNLSSPDAGSSSRVATSAVERLMYRSSAAAPSAPSSFARASVDLEHAPAVGEGSRGGRGGAIGPSLGSFDDGEGLTGGFHGGRGGSGGVRTSSFAASDPSNGGAPGLARRDVAAEATDRALAELLEETLKQMELHQGQPIVHLRLDQEVVRKLVSPISIKLEKDDYACFDRTDLQYQVALAEDGENPMLLSNYAQFLYIVRRNYDRSETFFHRALKEDPTDGDILGRYATFLWLGRGDKEGAERAYKAALATNPDNPYYTGSYAHFLWHTGEDETACPMV